MAGHQRLQQKLKWVAIFMFVVFSLNIYPKLLKLDKCHHNSIKNAHIFGFKDSKLICTGSLSKQFLGTPNLTRGTIFLRHAHAKNPSFDSWSMPIMFKSGLYTIIYEPF